MHRFCQIVLMISLRNMEEIWTAFVKYAHYNIGRMIIIIMHYISVKTAFF